MDLPILDDGDRVSHSLRGLGTVCISPQARGLVVTGTKSGEPARGCVFVIWDDERFPIEPVLQADLEPLSAGALAMSSGV